MDKKECAKCEIRKDAEQLNDELDRWWHGMADGRVKGFIASAISQYHPNMEEIVKYTGKSPADILWEDFNVFLKGSILRLFAQPDLSPDAKREQTEKVCAELSDLSLSYRYGLPMDDMTYDNGDLFTEYHSTYTFIHSQIKSLFDAFLTDPGSATN